VTEIANLLASAKNQLGYVASHDATGGVRHIQEKAAASVARHSLRAMELPTFAADPLRIVHMPVGTEAGKKTKLSDAVLAGSRAAAAGARLVLIPAAAEPITAGNGEVYFTKRETRFDVIDAADFAVVTDAADVTTSDLPVHRALVDLETMPALGFRVDLSRRDQKAYADGQLADTALASIALGLARAADQVLLAAIVASTPSAFTLAKAATAGFEFSELRALVGTAGTGAAVGQDGTLRAAGVMAELTPDAAATVVGSWSRAAIAVHEEITLTAERIDVNGGLTLTCWTNIQALLPLPGAFWTLGA